MGDDHREEPPLATALKAGSAQTSADETGAVWRGFSLDQVTAVVETFYDSDHQRLLTTRYLSECGCEWVVDMWGNVRRVMICPRDTDKVYQLDQLDLEFRDAIQGFWETRDN